MSVAVQPPQVILCGVSPCPAGCREGRGMPEVLGAAGQVPVLAEVWEFLHKVVEGVLLSYSCV